MKDSIEESAYQITTYFDRPRVDTANRTQERR